MSSAFSAPASKIIGSALARGHRTMMTPPMAVSKRTKASKATELLPKFPAKFLESHAGRIVQDPEIAITELVANAWDAGAGRVDISWPSGANDTMAVTDDGTGLTRAELEHRWMSINYNRLEEQGEDVEFPQGSKISARKAWGQNGVGRHAAFYFSDEYSIETRKAGKLTRATVRRTSGSKPYSVNVLEEKAASGHGTRISAVSRAISKTAEEISDLLGSRFFVDPSFSIYLNGVRVQTLEIKDAHEFIVGLASGPARVRRVDAEVARTARQNGIAWWVNGRLVGAPSWDLGFGPILDARRAAARKYTYIVEADSLRDQVKSDWTALKSTRTVVEAQRAIEDAVREDLNSVLGGERRERKRLALADNQLAMRELSPVSQDQIAQFLEEIQMRCPSIGDKELSDAVEVLTRLEKTRSGFALLEKLALLAPDDLDGLNHILSEWSVRDAKTVLNELRSRLALIQRLETLINNRQTDELHELQPLFERGLWIFGPEFEGPDFMANRALATVLKEFLGGDGETNIPRHRPDIIVRPNATLGAYSRDAYDERHEADGYSLIVVVELKRGGFEIGRGEKTQASEYCAALRRSGRVGRATRIVAYVLGSTVAEDAAEPVKEGETTIYPRPYDHVLRGAHARTFSLLRRINMTVTAGDEDVREIVTKSQTNFGDTLLPLT